MKIKANHILCINDSPKRKHFKDQWIGNSAIKANVNAKFSVI